MEHFKKEKGSYHARIGNLGGFEIVDSVHGDVVDAASNLKGANQRLSEWKKNGYTITKKGMW